MPTANADGVQGSSRGLASETSRRDSPSFLFHSVFCFWIGTGPIGVRCRHALQRWKEDALGRCAQCWLEKRLEGEFRFFFGERTGGEGRGGGDLCGARPTRVRTCAWCARTSAPACVWTRAQACAQTTCVDLCNDVRIDTARAYACRSAFAPYFPTFFFDPHDVPVPSACRRQHQFFMSSQFFIHFFYL